MSNGDEDQRVGEDTASGRTKRRAEKPISITSSSAPSPSPITEQLLWSHQNSSWT